VIDGDEISREHASIDNASDGVFLRDMGSVNGTFVNGNQVRDAVLNPGDQIAFDTERYVLETPAYVPGQVVAPEDEGEEQKSTTQVFTAPVIADQKDSEASPPEVVKKQDSAGRTRDLIIITVCAALSIAMLAWVLWP
jgi:pSer/pThr/pTyr-binding forkhead associated (FHA) protein